LFVVRSCFFCSGKRRMTFNGQLFLLYPSFIYLSPFKHRLHRYSSGATLSSTVLPFA
jgi:hypothetical protein